jgi:hypothetical protein
MYEYASLFIYGLSSDSASNSDYVAPNGMVINEWWIEKNVEGIECSLIWSNIPAFEWRDSGKRWKLQVMVGAVLPRYESRIFWMRGRGATPTLGPSAKKYPQTRV